MINAQQCLGLAEENLAVQPVHRPALQRVMGFHRDDGARRLQRGPRLIHVAQPVMSHRKGGEGGAVKRSAGIRTSPPL
ncbi:MAG: hypothetical protein QOE14_1795 [Humisphaera sp.]|nr:hypothetical protein [Humisphaera sp.]